MSSRELKKWLVLAAICVLMLALTGCACKHEETVTVNAADPLCLTDGYTGDLVCSSCDEVVTPGEAIPATGHTAGEPTNASEATCTTEGYTGDIPCAVCGEIITNGEAIPVTAHVEGDVINAAEASCTAEGYTGDIPCAICGEIITNGEAIAMTAHVEGELINAAEASCTAEGYTGDIPCAVCGEIIVPGETVAVTAHVEGEVVNAVEATCNAIGYTGDVPCSVCGEIITAGENIPMTAHTEGEVVSIAAASCSADGYTGDTVCSVCGIVMYEGAVIPATGHADVSCAETGEICPDCGAALSGAHSFADDICTGCGWMTPGLYVDGALVTPWDELLNSSAVTVENGQLAAIPGDMQMGTLVIGDEITAIGSLACDTLTEVWIPAGVTGWSNGLLAGNSSIETIRLFCAPADLTAFSGSPDPVRILLP